VADVANGLIGTQSSLGVIPLGTGNDFARMLGIGTDMRKAAQALAYADPFQCDACRWTLGDGTSRVSLNICGSGFDARVAERINTGIRGFSGTPAYLVAVIQELMSHRPARFEIIADGRRLDANAMLCSIANSESYGGGMRVAPKADLQDGLLDLVLVRAVGKLRFLTQFPKVFSGSHLDLPEVEFFQVRTIHVATDPPLPVLADGEVVGMTPVTYQVLPGVISVLRPEAPSQA
jgi:diacylglycerol kinase (ATP)